jgi:hypothetical protein
VSPAPAAWSFAVPDALPLGTYDVTVTATDPAGNTSTASGQLTVIAIPTPVITGFATDSNIAGDGITDDNTPTLSGTLAAGADRVRIFQNGVAAGTTPVDNGTWSFPSEALPDGAYSFTARAFDSAHPEDQGNPSNPLALTVDATQPGAPTLQLSQPLTPDGTSTADHTPALKGTWGAGNGETLALTVNGKTYPVPAASTDWSFDIPDALPSGRYTAEIKATDRAGNSSAATLGFDVVASLTLSIASVSDDGVQGAGHSRTPAISADGQIVAFQSEASNLIPPGTDNNGFSDIFVRDLTGITPVTTRVSVDRDGNDPIGPYCPGDGCQQGPSYAPAISSDGRYVTFYSRAINLVPLDTNLVRDFFRHDRQTEETLRVNLAPPNGAEAKPSGNSDSGYSYPSSVSADGRFVAFETFPVTLITIPPGYNGRTRDVFLRDMQGVFATLLSEQPSNRGVPVSGQHPSLSGDGSLVAFYSYARLSSADISDCCADVFIRDTQTGAITLVSFDRDNGFGGNLGSAHSFNPMLSGNGLYVVFQSYRSDLTPIDTHGQQNVFLRDMQKQANTLISVATDGITPGNGISGNANDPGGASVSDDGRYVAFQSDASNLVADGLDANGKTDVFLRDTKGTLDPLDDTTLLLSIDDQGNSANGPSYNPKISADGSAVAFESLASNLATQQRDVNNSCLDANNAAISCSDIFVVTGWK